MTVTTSLDDNGVAVLTFDDGGKNLLSLASIEALGKACAAAADARALVITGREGVLSAGLDLNHVKQHGRDGARDLVLALGQVAEALWLDPRPTVCAATGHALAGGVILAMSCDVVVAADGPWKWGLVETRVNLEVPAFALALAGQRMQARHINEFVLPGTPVDAQTAVRIGYADELVAPDNVLERAVAIAAERAELPAAAYAGNKVRLRAAIADDLRPGGEADVDAVVRHLDPA